MAPAYVRLIKRADYKLTEWKNGKGQSSEISIYPPESNFPSDPFLWRLSSAKIQQSGPFSVFPAFERYIVLVEGNVLLLKMPGLEHEEEKLLKLGEVYQFSGELSVSCEVMAESATDLNLIFDDQKVKSNFESIRITKKPRSFELTGKTAFLFPIDNPVVVTVYPGEIRTVVLPGDTLQVQLTDILERDNEKKSEDDNEVRTESARCVLLESGGRGAHIILIEMSF